jgi:protein SCO1/2
MPNPKRPSSEKRKLLAELRILHVVLAVLLGLFLAAGAIIWQIHKDEVRRIEMREEAMRPPTGSIGGPFTLTNQDGKTIHDTDFRGKYLLVYFGYTYCPDLCPTGLEGIAHVLDQLGDDAKKVQPIFITIDPARDTPAKLKEYVASFHPDIVGLTGTPEQIANVAKAYQVYYAKGENVEDGEYIMDHSTLIYVMDPSGKFVITFPDDADPAGMVQALRALWTKQKPVPGSPKTQEN